MLGKTSLPTFGNVAFRNELIFAKTIVKPKVYSWGPEKNDILRRDRNITFEEIVLNIHLGNEVDVYFHPNQEKYPGQKISVVAIEGYIYLVPFVETDDEYFLKTIIPSRKATKQYLEV